ncbi:hypothetical protein MLD38_040747 [Melastoma candidum]|nr:hypothetical protein MLD38_040747 [Melastoma candidum]
MDLSDVAIKLGLSSPNRLLLVRKASELRRLCDLHFDSSLFGVGEVCKAVICLEIAANGLQVIFDRPAAVKLSGLSDKAYTRSFNLLQNGLGVKNTLDVRELGIQFGCVRLIPSVKEGLSLYKKRFLASLPSSRKSAADFARPVFVAVAFYLCAKKHKLKVDKSRLIEVCGTSEQEFSSVSNSMIDLCYDLFGVSKEKKDPREVQGNRDLLDALPGKRKPEDGGYLSDDEPKKKCKEMEKRRDYEAWKSTVLASDAGKKHQAASRKRVKQTRLDFGRKACEGRQTEEE